MDKDKAVELLEEAWQLAEVVQVSLALRASDSELYLVASRNVSEAMDCLKAAGKILLEDKAKYANRV